MPRALQPARQPEAVAARLEGDHDALDRASCLLRFVAPSMQQLQQCALVGSELLQRLALDARHNAGNEPTSLFGHRETTTASPNQMVQISSGAGTAAPDFAISRMTCITVRHARVISPWRDIANAMWRVMGGSISLDDCRR